MAKKKKGGGKAGGDEAQSARNKLETELELLRMQVEHDKDRVKRILKNFEEVRNEKVQLSLKLEAQEIKQQEIEQTLRREIAKERETVNELRKKNKVLEGSQDTVVDVYEKKMTAIKLEHTKHITEVEEKYESLSQLYNKVVHFQQNMERIENEMKEKDREIMQLKRQQNMITLELETRHLESTEGLKKSMNSLFKDTKEGMLAMTENQLHSTTKRTIMENQSMGNELNFQTKETQRVIKRNEKLQRQNQELKRRISLLESEQEMLVKRSNFYQKMNNRLGSKIKQLQYSQKNAQETYSQLESVDRCNLEAEIEAMRQHIAKLEGTYEMTKKELEEVYEELDEQKRTSESFLHMQDEGTAFLLACLQDVKQQFVTEKNRKGFSPDSMTFEDREAMLQVLLQKLNQSKRVGSIQSRARAATGDGRISFPPIPTATLGRRRNPNSLT